MHGARRFWATLLLAGCVSVAPAPDRATLWGRVELEPHADLPRGAGGAGYVTRSVRDARGVDYARPGFTVVYAPDVRGERRDARIELHDIGGRPRLHPARVAISGHGAFDLVNLCGAARSISVPALGLLQRLEPGATLRVRATAPGPLEIFVPGTRSRATVFAAPGRFAVTTPRGDWSLTDLPPGALRVHAWHPRFPPDQVEVDAPAGERTRVELHLGVTASRRDGP